MKSKAGLWNGANNIINVQRSKQINKTITINIKKL